MNDLLIRPAANDAAESTATPAPADGAKPHYRRRHYLIDPQLQGRYFLNILCLTAVVAFGVTMASAHYFLFTVKGVTLAEPQLKAQFTRIAIIGAALAALVLPVSSIFLSHRFAGPAYRLRKACADVIAGRLSYRIHLRRYDHLKSTAESFNQMLAVLEQRQRAELDTREAARQAIHAALDKLASGGELDTPEALRLLEEAEARLRDVI